MNLVCFSHDGFKYTGHFEVTGRELSVFHHLATKKATLHGDDPATLATQLMFEIVVRAGQGIPDPQDES